MGSPQKGACGHLQHLLLQGVSQGESRLPSENASEIKNCAGAHRQQGYGFPRNSRIAAR